MRDALVAWDFVRQRGFTGPEAAMAMVGEQPAVDSMTIVPNARTALELIRDAYEAARRWFATAPEDSDTLPRALLLSVEMQDAQGRTDSPLVEVAGDFRFLLWLRTPMAEFNRQHFSPDVLAHWVQQVGVPSRYPFGGPESTVVPVAGSTTQVPALKFKTTKAALIAAHVHEWPTIARDIADAKQNGLAAAKADVRGWMEDAAMDWARAKGKLIGTAKPGSSLAQAMHNLGSLPGKKYTLEG